MTRKINWTPEILDFIEQHTPNMVRPKLVQMLFETFPNADPEIKPTAVASLCKRKGWVSGISTTFKKGQPTWNKGKKGYMGANRTSFKKGNMPYTHKPVGSTRIDKADGYVLVKVAEPRTWRHRHSIVWEQHHGKVPKGHIIRHIDGDPTNDDIENLICIPRGANARINHRNKANTDNPELNKAIILTEHLRYESRRKR